MPLEIASPRLTLRAVTVEDCEPLHRLWTDAAVRRFLWDDQVIPLEQTQEIVATSTALFAAHAFGLFGVRFSGRPELVGFAGFWHFRTPPERELLFGVHSAHWGQGIATESATCVLDYGFGTVGFPEVQASTDVANEASVRVLEKLGMRHTRRAMAEGLDTLFFEMSARAWTRGG